MYLDMLDFSLGSDLADPLITTSGAPPLLSLVYPLTITSEAAHINSQGDPLVTTSVAPHLAGRHLQAALLGKI